MYNPSVVSEILPDTKFIYRVTFLKKDKNLRIYKETKCPISITLTIFNLLMFYKCSNTNTTGEQSTRS